MLKVYLPGRERLRRILTESGWILIGQVLTVVGSVVLVRILTDFLEPVIYGQLALGLTVSVLINQTIMAGVMPGIARFYTIAKDKGDFPGFFVASQKIMLYATLSVCFVAAVLILCLLHFGYYHWIGLTVTILLFTTLTGYNSAISQIQNASRQRAVVGFHSGLDAWLKIGLAVLFMMTFGHSSEAVVAGYTISSLIVTISQLFFLYRRPEFKTVDTYQQNKADIKKWMQKIWAFAWPFSTWGIFTWAQLSSDRWALELFESTKVVGLFSVLYQLGYAPIVILSTLVITFLSPVLYKQSGDATNPDNNKAVHQLSWKIAGLGMFFTALVVLFTFFFHGFLFKILVSDNFRERSYLLPWMILAGGLYATGQILALKLMSEMKTRKIIPVKIGTALVGVGLNVVGAKYFGLDGVVWSAVLFSCIYIIWIGWVSRV